MPHPNLFIGFDLDKDPTLLEAMPRMQDTSETYRVYWRSITHQAYWYRPEHVTREWRLCDETSLAIPIQWRAYLLLLGAS